MCTSLNNIEIIREKICGINAVHYQKICGDDADCIWLFVHGKSGYKEEAGAFAEIACPKGWQVLSIDLPEHGERKGEPGLDPWHVVPELQEVMAYMRKRWKRIALRANSIGAWFSMLAFTGIPLEKALFVSPILDMEELIRGMMLFESVDDERLEREGEIPTALGETLSWSYLKYVKEHPVEKWDVPSAILYAGQDNLTRRDTVDAFVKRFGCELTVMENGEHWFHTSEQLEMLKNWEEAHI
ncbi:MAG: alpha/beta hydrolase [Clostridiaceae bacterium]|nr:alpha/beta hydrolase [Clostridiaceae bacterium]